MRLPHDQEIEGLHHALIGRSAKQTRGKVVVIINNTISMLVKKSEQDSDCRQVIIFSILKNIFPFW